MSKFGIGQSVQRVEDERFLRGAGAYIDDIALPRQCHAVVLMSTQAHARIAKLDVSKAKAAEGVVCVLTGADAVADGLGGFPPLFMPEDMGGPKGFKTSRPVLAVDVVRFVGDRVALVVAETAEEARAASELIEVDYDPLPAVVDLEQAVADGAPQLWEGAANNTSYRLMFGNKDATDAAFAGAACVVKLRLENNRISANSLEPRGAIGQYNSDGTYTLHTSSQNPHSVRSTLATHIFKMTESRLRVITPDVGGGFGMKAEPYPEDALVLWAARKCGRPVKWIPTRGESLLGDTHGRDQVVKGEMAFDKSGKILGIRADALHAMGAYIFSAGVAPTVFSMRFIPSVYDCKTIHISTRAVFTNTSPMGPYRGAGRPEATYLVERLLDKGALQLGIDPVEIRRRNYIKPEAMPYMTATGFNYDSGEFEQTMDKCLKLADWDGFANRKAQSEAKGLKRGRSVAYFIEMGGIFNERMELRFDPSGCVTIVAGTHSHGQGHATTFAQLVAEFLGVPFDSVKFVQGDTDKVPMGRGTYAARSSLVGGCALRLASDAIIEKCKKMAGFLLEASPADIEFKDGILTVVGTNKSVTLVDAAKAFYRKGGLPKDLGLGLEASGSYAAEPPNFPNGCHVCEIEVDPRTGFVRIDRYACVDDLGVVINPMICEGQVHGALAQGIGQALYEHLVYDKESGQLLTGSFMDYAMPRADDFPHFELGFHDVPAKTNPLGIKGIGEAGTVGATPAVINAILDALRPLGVEHIDMPATPNRVWEAIEAARRPAAA